jgi:chromosome transmission fidelity protein 18
MSPSLRKYLNTEVVIMDVLPPLMEIIQPNLRPINTQLYSAREKEEMAQLIHIMIACNMTYHQEKDFSLADQRLNIAHLRFFTCWSKT